MASIVLRCSTSEQALYRLLRLFYKSQSKLTPLLLLSKSNPLHWASIWFWVQTWKLLASILLRCSTSEQTSYRLLRLFYKSQSALTPLLLLSKPNPLSLGFGLGPPLRGGFVLLQENIGRNQPFHIVFSPSEYIPSVDEHKSSGAGTIKCRTARNRWEGVRFSWTVSHTDVSLKGVVPDGRKKQAYPACAHCQERMK